MEFYSTIYQQNCQAKKVKFEVAGKVGVLFQKETNSA